MKKLNLLMLISKTTLSLLISVMGTILLSEVATAQNKPSCFMRDTSGKVIDLSDLCDSRSKKVSNTKNKENLNNIVNTTINESALVNNTTRRTVYFLGNGTVPFNLSSPANTYYTGAQSAAYIRRYPTSQSVSNREASRINLLSTGEILSRNINDRPITTIPSSRLIVPERTPFIIYRYTK